MKILSTGMYVPEKLVTNEQMYERFGREKLEPVYQRIGHGARYHSAADETSADLAVKAAQDALAASGV